MKNPQEETKGPIPETTANLSNAPATSSEGNIAGRVTEKGNKSNSRTPAAPGGAQGPIHPEK